MSSPAAPLRVLSLATLYPNPLTPNFGVFVARQMEAVVRTGAVELVVVNALGLPPWPLDRHPRYRALARLPDRDTLNAVTVLRPRFAVLPLVGGRFSAASLARAVLPLARRLHADRPFDLVDAQFFYPDGPAAARIGEALGVPVSIKARGADIHYWGQRGGTRGPIMKAAHQAEGLLAVSAGLAADMAALGMPAERIAVHRTGLDHARFRPLDRAACRQALGLAPAGPVLATVGALIPRKGQRFVIEALPDLPAATLVLAGAGPDEAELRALAARLGVDHRVRFLGAVPHADLPQVLNAADVFVLPSASEGLANAWVEALACGTPVVTTPLAGAQDLLTRPEHGRFAGRDARQIAAAVAQLLADPPAREAVAAAAAAFSWEANAAALIAHWRRLAA